MLSCSTGISPLSKISSPVEDIPQSSHQPLEPMCLSYKGHHRPRQKGSRPKRAASEGKYQGSANPSCHKRQYLADARHTDQSQGPKTKHAERTLKFRRTEKACFFCKRRKIKCRPHDPENARAMGDTTCYECHHRKRLCSLKAENDEYMPWHPPSSEQQGIPASELPRFLARQPPGTTLLLKPRQWTQVSSSFQIPDTNGHPAYNVNDKFPSTTVQDFIHAQQPTRRYAIKKDRLLARGTFDSYGQCVHLDREDPDDIDPLK